MNYKPKFLSGVETKLCKRITEDIGIKYIEGSCDREPVLFPKLEVKCLRTCAFSSRVHDTQSGRNDWVSSEYSDVETVSVKLPAKNCNLSKIRNIASWSG